MIQSNWKYKRSTIQTIVVVLGLMSYFTTQAQEYEWRRKRPVRRTPPAPASTVPPPIAPVPKVPVPPPQSGIITGLVIDEDGQPLPGTAVVIQNTTYGIISDGNGAFRLENIHTADSIVIKAEFLGYEPQILKVPFPQLTPLLITLKEKLIVTQEIVVTASRQSEAQAVSPVTTYKMDQLNLRDAPTLNAYQASGYQPGVQVINSSVLLNSFNIRGLGQTLNPRVLNLADGIDLQLASLGVALGAINGIPDLDIAAAEVVAGPASALYGPNAFNGVFSAFSKDPFLYPGLSVSIKTGLMHIDSRDNSPQPFNDVGIRFAKVFSNKFAIKLNIAALHAEDWHANDTRDFSFYPGTKYTTPGSNNPGYDGVNRYGDSEQAVLEEFSTQTFAGPLVLDPVLVGRTGFNEKDLANYNTQNLKLGLSLHYRLGQKHEIIAGFRGAVASGVVQTQAIRVRIHDVLMGIAHLELKHPRYFVRTYFTGENQPNSQNLSALGVSMVQLMKPDELWFPQFTLAYNPDNPTVRNLFNAALVAAGRVPFAEGDPVAARNFADSDNSGLFPYLYQALVGQGLDTAEARQQAMRWTAGSARAKPGTIAFDSLRSQISKRNLSELGGARMALKARVQHTEAQYSFPNLFTNADFIIGASLRNYMAFSDNRFFYEEEDNISLREFGAYAQGLFQLADNRLRVAASIRIDKNQNFKAQLSPRLGLNYALGANRNHNLRLAFNTGFRPPTLEQQFIHLPNPNNVFMGGNEALIDEYSLKGNLYRITSVRQFFKALENNAPIDTLVKFIQPYNIQPIQPEVARSIEAGYRANIASKWLIDTYGYFTLNQDIITVQNFLGPPQGFEGIYDIYDSDETQLYTPYVNLDKNIYTYGIALQVAYNFSAKYSISLNYGYNNYISDDEIKEVLIENFATPNHIARAFFTARNIGKYWGAGLGINYASQFETSFENNPFPLTVPSYTTFDAQISRRIPALKLLLRAGGTNLFNHRHIQVLGGGTVGAQLYLQVVFDSLF